jgi:IPT/TIG domain
MLDVGLGPFVALQTTSGEVGAKVDILGTDLTGATSVKFNGTVATFTVNSTGTAITATVPIGATTGSVQVVTPDGTLKSNVAFVVN